ncbi:ABC transporter ATP-binding protein [Bifidobacterium aquikefiri]|uniref:Multidrug ABC transporter ATP-binding protein n=2 Tax=Bifidobacterium aquikefiri TaxID=1653207 RepID=A0A261GB23_9BIFI|nr:ABC transporter ATP-binding protein [Bifidobacterium aquikefiri]OZG68443.1 multidrug ABC transporter ATP-binding protein [Bifidobacterium aquikefiri]
MLRICKYLSKLEIGELILGVALVISQVWFDLKLPDYMSDVTRIVETPNSKVSQVWTAGGKMLLISLGSIACAIATGFIAARVAATFTQRLRSLEFKHVESFSTQELGNFSTASLITRSTNDITQIQMFITMGLLLIVRAPVMAVWAVLKIAGKGFEWTVATGVAVAFLVVAIIILMSMVGPKFRSMQRLTDNINLVARENLTGLRVVRAYNAEDYQEEKFDHANDDLTSTQLFTNRAIAVLMPMMNTVLNGLMLAVYWIGAYLIEQATLGDKLTLFSNMVVFSSYSVQVIMGFLLMSMVFVLLPRANVSANRILEVLDTPISISDGSRDDGEQGLKGTVEFRNMGFKYPDAKHNVLDDISFTVSKGQTIAFIGATGSGKSTLINLVPRFYDASSGQVLVDGVNVKDYKLSALRNKIGYVPQESFLFRGTVESNIAYGAKADAISPEKRKEGVETAASIAHATEFVEKMPEGFDSPIAQSGSNVSGGQKQRLSIARAVWSKPEILIFDDSFSALDFKTDREVRDALARETAGSTVMIVAQRIGTIMNADTIVVLDEGRIVGVGTHKQLLDSCEIYRQIAESQLSAKELVD